MLCFCWTDWHKHKSLKKVVNGSKKYIHHIHHFWVVLIKKSWSLLILILHLSMINAKICLFKSVLTFTRKGNLSSVSCLSNWDSDWGSGEQFCWTSAAVRCRAASTSHEVEQCVGPTPTLKVGRAICFDGKRSGLASHFFLTLASIGTEIHLHLQIYAHCVEIDF